MNLKDWLKKGYIMPYIITKQEAKTLIKLKEIDKKSYRKLVKRGEVVTGKKACYLISELVEVE